MMSIRVLDCAPWFDEDDNANDNEFDENDNFDSGDMDMKRWMKLGIMTI